MLMRIDLRMEVCAWQLDAPQRSNVFVIHLASRSFFCCCLFSFGRVLVLDLWAATVSTSTLHCLCRVWISAQSSPQSSRGWLHWSSSPLIRAHSSHKSWRQ